MNDYVRTVYTHEPPLDKRLDQKAVSLTRLITVDFNQGDVVKTLSSSDTKNQQDKTNYILELHHTYHIYPTFSLSRN